MPADKRAPNQTDVSMSRRLKMFRDQNPQGSDAYLLACFKKLIGGDDCLSLSVTAPMAPDTFATQETKFFGTMRHLLEQNGKPCCINLITESDNKFLANLKKQENFCKTAFNL